MPDSPARPRLLHFVGTLPQFPSPTAALRWQRDSLAERTRAWFGGETGARSQWFVPVIKRLQASAKVRTVRHGSWTDYDDVDRLALRRGHRLRPDDIPLGIADHFREEREALRDVLGERTSKPLQVGIPGYLDMALFTFGPRGVLRHARTFRRALSGQVDAIQGAFPGEAVFQLEVPLALIAVASAPRPLRPWVARVMAHLVLAQVRAAPSGTRFGVHLCLGDLGHHALRQLDDAGALVDLATALVRRWPRHAALEFVHLPFSGGTQPPATDPGFYEPLRRLRTSGVPVVAGIAHEEQSLAEQRTVLAMVEARLGHPVDVATSCGLGRRPAPAAEAVVRRMVELADS